jgi:hypothetical protein
MRSDKLIARVQGIKGTPGTAAELEVPCPPLPKQVRIPGGECGEAGPWRWGFLCFPPTKGRQCSAQSS